MPTRLDLRRKAAREVRHARRYTGNVGGEVSWPKMRRFAFAEQDAPMIEAQQRMIENATTPLNPVILAVDVGPVRYKRVLNKLLEAERRRAIVPP